MTDTAADARPRPKLTAARLVWPLAYIGLIPLVNWSFTWAPNWTVFGDVAFNPVTIATGLVLVFRDFAQRQIGHWVLVAMAIALGLSVWVAGPEIALASGAAFAISELVDWALFTFTRYRLSTRIMLSSLIAAPLDSIVFLYGAEFVRSGSLSVANAVMSIIGKLSGAVVVSAAVRMTERPEEGPRAAPASPAAPDRQG
ncbi:MAG: VUT family protein [Caulobacterales bacterium]|nr:VUT family protein [Caulobacterales bacterium]